MLLKVNNAQSKRATFFEKSRDMELKLEIRFKSFKLKIEISLKKIKIRF